MWDLREENEQNRVVREGKLSKERHFEKMNLIK